MIKISGRITNTPPPLPKDGNMYTMEVKIGTPIEGVKVTDGQNVVLSDKDGKYEITTDKQYLTFSKEKYVNETIDLYAPQSHFRSDKKNVVLKKSDGTTTETKSNSEEKMLFGFKQKFLINVALGLAVIGIGWYFYKSKKK